MNEIVKCENCGANLEIDKEHLIKFCPYCGAAIRLPETNFDHEKYMAEFNEKVRQTKQKEAEKDKKRDMLILACAFLLLFIIAYVIPALR